MGRFFDYQSERFPKHYLRIWRVVLMWWPNEPWWNRLEICFRRSVQRSRKSPLFVGKEADE